MINSTISSKIISVILPTYSCAESVSFMYEEISSSLANIFSSYEIIFIDDGSPGDDWKEIQNLCNVDKRVKGLKFARNFGQHEAITAGLSHAKGDYVIVMDCDLQHDPAYIPALLRKSLEGYDIVYACHKERKHASHRNFLANLFELLFNWLVRDTSSNHRHSSYTCISRKTVRAFLKINDHHRHYLLILKWLGFKSAEVEVVHRKRTFGKSSYTLLKLLKHAINGFTSQTTLFLKFSTILGLIYLLGATLYSSYIIIGHFAYGFKEGWASLILLILFSTGVILLTLGVIGTYISKVLEQVRQRPLFIVNEYLNLESPNYDN